MWTCKWIRCTFDDRKFWGHTQFPGNVFTMCRMVEVSVLSNDLVVFKEDMFVRDLYETLSVRNSNGTCTWFQEMFFLDFYHERRLQYIFLI